MSDTDAALAAIVRAGLDFPPHWQGQNQAQGAAKDALAALVSRVQELEAALRSLKHQYLPNMPFCDCPTCRAIDRALSAGGTTPPQEPTVSGYMCPVCAHGGFEPFRCGGPHDGKYEFVDAVPVGGAVAPQVEDTPASEQETP